MIKQRSNFGPLFFFTPPLGPSISLGVRYERSNSRPYGLLSVCLVSVWLVISLNWLALFGVPIRVPEMSIRDVALYASVDGETVAQVLLLTGPEMIDVVSDIAVIMFLIFAFFALIVFLVMALLMYRRVAGLVEALTKAAERGDRLLQELGDITEKVKSGGALPGMAFRGLFGTMSSVLGEIMGLRRRRNRNSD